MPTIDGEVVLMRDIKARLTDAQGNEMVLALTDLDADDAFEVIFEGVDPELGPYQIDFTSDLDLTLATDPSTPESVELEPGDSTYSYTLTSVTGPVAAAATLVVRLLFDESWEIDSDEVDCAMTNDDGATVTGNFIEVSGAWEVTFENLDPAKSWVIDLDEPSGVTVNTTPDLPYDVQLAEGQTTTIEFQVDSVTFDL
jgi:hypothetical protein